MADENPFTIAYAKFWEVLEDSSTFREMVPVGNRIKYEDELSPEKYEAGDGDFPYVIVAANTSEPQGSMSSSTIAYRHTYRVAIGTGDERLSFRYFPLEFEIFKRIVQWWKLIDPSNIETPKFKGNAFVWNIAWADPAQVTLDDVALNLGIRGWSAVWAIALDMKFSRTDLGL